MDFVKIQPFTHNRFQQGLLGIYSAVWIWASISPVDRSDWLLENLLVVAAAGFLYWIYRSGPLSNVSAALVTLFMIFHAVGSHYTYSLVPAGDWLKQLGWFERNHYDRLVHFFFGLLLSYPFCELLKRYEFGSDRRCAMIAFMVIATWSGFYELLEWLAAVIVEPSAGNAFLGTQGDEFDSQKDHALALIGSGIALSAATTFRK